MAWLPFGLNFYFFLVLRVYVGQFWALGKPIFEVPSSNRLHEELSRIESSINQVSVPQNVKIFAVSWPSRVTHSIRP